jgi:hypothetical protein
LTFFVVVRRSGAAASAGNNAPFTGVFFFVERLYLFRRDDFTRGSALAMASPLTSKTAHWQCQGYTKKGVLLILVKKKVAKFNSK